MRSVFCVTALVAVFLSGAAFAFNSYSMRDLPVRYMTDEDREIFKAALVDVLERARDGESTRWENPKTGAHGDLAPLASFDRDGQRCRDLDVANSARGRSNRLVVTLCKQADGEWKIESR
jgi:surface antigen